MAQPISKQCVEMNIDGSSKLTEMVRSKYTAIKARLLEVLYFVYICMVYGAMFTGHYKFIKSGLLARVMTATLNQTIELSLAKLKIK